MNAIPDLYPVTVCEHFGVALPYIATHEQATKALAEALRNGKIDPRALTDIHEAMVAAVREMQWELRDGKTPKRRLVRGQVLADWLGLGRHRAVARQG